LQGANGAFCPSRRAIGTITLKNSSKKHFEGRIVLFIERSHLLNDAMYRSIERLGPKIIGPLCSAAEVATILRHVDIDAAILDRDCDGQADIRQLLDDHGIPSVYSCNLKSCRSGKDACYRLFDEKTDPVQLLNSLFQDRANPAASANGHGRLLPGRSSRLHQFRNVIR
jgi:hypothetical protein